MTGKVAPSCPSATTRATINSSRKRFSSPKLGVERRGGGLCQASQSRVDVARKFSNIYFNMKGSIHTLAVLRFILKVLAGNECFHSHWLENVGVGEGKS